MESILTPSTIIQQAARDHGDSTLFYVPHESTSPLAWRRISYARFATDVLKSATYWKMNLITKGVRDHATVGVWLSGLTYSDAVHIYGLTSAGYVPQLISLRLPSAVVVFELLRKAGAEALVHDAECLSLMRDTWDGILPLHVAPNIEALEVQSIQDPLPGRLCADDDLIFIFHTSGSTSGSPKLVPCSYRWYKSFVDKASRTCGYRGDVSTWMGSMCHIAQSSMFIGTIYNGAAIIQPTVISFSSQELLAMRMQCGLNRLTQFASFLGIHLRNARIDPKILECLTGLDQVVYSGLPLPQGEEKWARQNRLPLRNLFGSTECGALMMSSVDGPHAAGLRPLGTLYNFRLVDETVKAAVTSVHRSTGAEPLRELVLPPDSPDRPDLSLCSLDGSFPTGDLFREISPGVYASCGRADDWIKSETSLRCDTKSIEDNVRITCKDIVSDCVVIGNARPSPALIVEPADELLADDQAVDKLKMDIIRRIRPFHARRYVHEKITNPELVHVVASKTLPRTSKGNIRRRAVEEMFATELDVIYEKVRLSK